jgi:glycosyltransferase involved in cell wall biosynthesis
VRILVPTTWFPAVDDPVRAVFVRRHVEALALVHDVEVLALLPAGVTPAPPSPSLPRLTVTHVPVTLGDARQMVRAARVVRARAAATRPDIIHSMGFSSLPFAAAAHGTPWVHTEHWSGVTHPASAGRAWSAARGARHLLRLPRRVTAVSTDMAGHLRHLTRRGALEVVGNVVPPAVPVPRSGVPGLRLLAVGSLVDVKDPLLAVATVAALHAQGHDVTLRWAGSGRLADAVVRAARQHGVQGQVVLLGSVPPEHLAEHFDWSTAFVLPTRHETFCVAAAEALAHGRPVVVGAVGGQRDFVTSQVGALVESRDPDAWAAAVLDAHERLGAAPLTSFTDAVSRFRPGPVAERFGLVYERAIG